MRRDGRNTNEHKLVRIVIRQKRILERARYPLRRSKYSNHIYNDHQHIILLALRQHFKKSYREFCDIMEVCTELLDEIGLDKIPHWTTLQKFSARANMRRLENLLLACLEEARLRILCLAVDSSGFSSTSASSYYVQTIKQRSGKRGRPREGRHVRRYVKQTMAVETRKQLIVAMKFRMGPANDSPDFIPVLKKVEPARQPVKIVLADKGYDSESNHEYAQEILGARTVIPVRASSRPKIKMRGRRRKRMAREFDEREYHQRAKAETVFSVEKRIMGSYVQSRGVSQQHKELLLRALSYNSNRLELLFLVFIEDFYKALSHKQHQTIDMNTAVLDSFNKPRKIANFSTEKRKIEKGFCCLEWLLVKILQMPEVYSPAGVVPHRSARRMACHEPLSLGLFLSRNAHR